MALDRPPAGIEWGVLPRTSVCGDGTWLRAVDRFDPLPRSEWKATSNRRHIKHIYSQLDGMCTSNATCSALMAIRSMQGQPNVILSPENLYPQHSNWGTGSTLDENLRCIRDVGVCTRATIPQSKWRPSSWPSNWKTEAKRYRIIEWFDLDGRFDMLATALQYGFVVQLGVRWPGGGGHSVLASDLVKAGSRWNISGPNSWGRSWGDGGFYTLTESQLRSMPGFGCWCARSAVIPSGE